MLKQNYLPETYANEIESILISPNFAWYYWNALAHSIQTYKKEFHFQHIFCAENESQSPYFEFLKPFLYITEQQFDFKIKGIRRFKANLQTHSEWTEQEKEVLFHKDWLDESPKRMSLLYYVNNSDGNTIVKTDDGVVEYQPQKNSAVLIQSNQVHRSTYPVNHSQRIVFNLMFEIY